MEFWATELLVAASRFSNVKALSLALGIGALFGGVFLLFGHKRELDVALAGPENDRVKAFEKRKYRRRASASTMIACLGCLLAGLYWVTDQRVFAIFIAMILALLLGIFGLAILDLFSVGIHHIATPDQKAQRKMIEEYLEERQKLLEKSRQEKETGDTPKADE